MTVDRLADLSAAVDVVIVTHNSAHLIKAVLRALLGPDRQNGRVIVSDSGSTDETPNIVKAISEVVFIANENRGFGFACNVGARYSFSNHIAFINPDVIVTWSHLMNLTQTAKELEASAIAPILVDGNGRVTSAGSRSICPPWRRRGSLPSREDHPYPVETTTGACLVIEREMFDRLGGFDEAFFLYAEENDLLKRIRDVGGSVIVDPRLRIVHIGEASSTGVPEWWRGMHRMRSHRLYVAKHFSAGEAFVDGLASTIRILTSRRRTFRLKTVAGLWRP
jgi:N-acetylglucosaminyl-diphospho-decaprenol L-rhamnosyltransferase